MSSDAYDLTRFVEAQDANGTHDRALRELRNGRKVSHWMWFVFPQVAGLGSSPMAQRYAIASLDEAAAYLAHPVLGARLVEATQAMLGVDERRSAEEVLGSIDAMKLHSSMTLFSAVESAPPVFQQVLDRFFDGQHDPETTSRAKSTHP